MTRLAPPLRTVQARRAQDRSLARTCAAVALVVLPLMAWGTGKALAEIPPSRDRVTLHPGDGDCFAIIHVTDRVGTYNRTETIETAHGPVSVRYITHGGQDDLDEASVVDTPPNVVADPWDTELVPGQPVPICLRLWEGM